MRKIFTEVSTLIGSTPETIYSILSDYKVGHPAILPKTFFTDYTVLEGGTGAGTLVRIGMTVLGVKQTLTLQVSEPEPGRVLQEEDKLAGVVTTFTIEPVGSGDRSQITIATHTQASPGLGGLLEQWLNPLITRRIYKKELQLLADYAQRREQANHDR